MVAGWLRVVVDGWPACMGRLEGWSAESEKC